MVHVRFHSPEVRRRWLEEAESQFTAAGRPRQDTPGLKQLLLLSPGSHPSMEARVLLYDIVEIAGKGADQPRKK